MVANVRQFLHGLAFKAIEVAKAKDMNPDMRIPPYKVTYVYRLMEQYYSAKRKSKKLIAKSEKNTIFRQHT